MIELEEAKQNLSNFKNRLESLGDSLWLTKNGKRTKRTRRKNYGKFFLGG